MFCRSATYSLCYPLVGSLRLLQFGTTLFGGGYSGQPYTHRCAAAGTLRDGDLVRVRVRVREKEGWGYGKREGLGLA